MDPSDVPGFAVNGKSDYLVFDEVYPPREDAALRPFLREAFRDMTKKEGLVMRRWLDEAWFWASQLMSNPWFNPDLDRPQAEFPVHFDGMGEANSYMGRVNSGPFLPERFQIVRVAGEVLTGPRQIRWTLTLAYNHRGWNQFLHPTGEYRRLVDSSGAPPYPAADFAAIRDRETETCQLSAPDEERGPDS